jgi:hypothetical protein
VKIIQDRQKLFDRTGDGEIAEVRAFAGVPFAGILKLRLQASQPFYGLVALLFQAIDFALQKGRSLCDAISDCFAAFDSGLDAFGCGIDGLGFVGFSDFA